MDDYLLFPQPTDAQFNEGTSTLLGDAQSSQTWLAAREQACAILEQHTESLRQLMAQMRSFNYLTDVEVVMQAQSRSEALRWLMQRIEREIQQLDKRYREVAQREQFLRDQALLTAVSPECLTKDKVM